MRKALFIALGVFVVILLLAAVFVTKNIKSRHPGYSVDLDIKGSNPGMLRAGFAAVDITPQIPYRWTDANNDAKYDPKDGDSFQDGNGNGRFDPIWIAGFGNGRAANGIHDKLWARTMVLDDGHTRLAITVLDAIGFMHDDIIDVRQMIPKEAGITYSIICSTHDHEAPDLLGLWGSGHFRSGVNATYLAYLKKQTAKSIEIAAARLRPAILKVAEDQDSLKDLLMDTRPPEVFDPGLRCIVAVDAEGDSTLGTLIAWADHAETLWSKNLLITSDFPHYVREGVEKGIYVGDSLVKKGIGGVAVYVNGAIGGLMTTHPKLTVRDPFTGQNYKEPTFEKAKAQGDQIASLAIDLLQHATDTVKQGAISLKARSISLPLDNPLFKLAAMLGVIPRGMDGWMKMNSEVSAFRIGPLSFVTVPGEIYPEIVNGGIESPEGQDIAISPVETPPIRDLMPGKYKFVFGLANDEIGYIIPKSEWDDKPPYIYGLKSATYGESNSLGPETAPIVYKALKGVLAGD